MTLTWQNAEWADGPAVAAYLDGRVHPSQDRTAAERMAAA